jgi:integrase
LTGEAQAYNNSPTAILFGLGVRMPRGSLRCSKCHKAMSGPVCECGHSICYLSLYWQKKQHRFFRYHVDDELFDYNRALKQLAEMNLAIEKRNFRPRDWTSQAVKARSFKSQMERWLEQKKEEKEAGEFAPGTLRVYRSYSRNHYSFFNSMNVSEITFEELENFKDSLAHKGISIKMRRNILNGLHAFFNWLYRKGVIKVVPPFPVVEGDDAKLMIALTYQEQMEALERLPQAHRDVIEFGFECGLRPGELCALKVKDIDSFKRWALIQRTYSAHELKETTKAKNKKWIPLSDRAFEIASRHLRDKLPEAFLFINPLTRRGYKMDFLRSLWRSCSGTEVTLYEAMRHSFCTQIVEDGASDRQAQELMRHTDKRSTEKYIHASVERHRELVNRRGRGKMVSLMSQEKNPGNE